MMLRLKVRKEFFMDVVTCTVWWHFLSIPFCFQITTVPSSQVSNFPHNINQTMQLAYVLLRIPFQSNKKKKFVRICKKKMIAMGIEPTVSRCRDDLLVVGRLAIEPRDRGNSHMSSAIWLLD